MTATGTATFNSKDVLTANLVTANSNLLADGLNGGLASNYSLVTGQTVAANITPAPLTGTAIAGVSTTYGTPAAPGAVTFGNVISGDDVTSTASIVSPAYSTSANLRVGSYTQTAITLSGGDAGNYTLTPYTTPTANYTSANWRSGSICWAKAARCMTATPRLRSTGSRRRFPVSLRMMS